MLSKHLLTCKTLSVAVNPSDLLKTNQPPALNILSRVVIEATGNYRNPLGSKELDPPDQVRTETTAIYKVRIFTSTTLKSNKIKNKKIKTSATFPRRLTHRALSGVFISVIDALITLSVQSNSFRNKFKQAFECEKENSGWH